MQIIKEFNPSLASNGVIEVGAADAGSTVLFYNESIYNLDIDFYNGNQATLHAWEARAFVLDGDTKQLGWRVASTLSVSGGIPSSLVTGELYGPTEKLAGAYPISLVRQINTGNVVNTVGGTANLVQNDATFAGAAVVEATVLGDVSSAVKITNDAVMTLGNAAHNGSLSTAGTIFANNGINTNTLRDDTNGNTVMDMTSGDGSAVMPHSLTVQTQLLLGTGSLSKIAAFGPYAVTAVATQFNHNLGVTPDLILLVQSSNGTVHALSYEDSTLTTTKVTLLAGGNSNVRGLAIKF